MSPQQVNFNIKVIMEKTLESCLSNEKVYVKFYRRKKGNITDNPKHVANGGMLENSFKELVPPMLRNGQRKNILTDNEKDFLEEYMHLPKGTLSIYNKDFWDKRRVILYKTDNVFDLSDPDQYIDCKIVMAYNNLVAPNLDSIPHKQTYMFFIEREGEEEARKTKNVSIKKECYKLFGKIEENKEALRYVLRQAGKPTAKSTKIETLQGWVGDLIEEKPYVFEKLASDPLMKTKMFLELAVDLGLVALREGEYFDGETGKPISSEGKPSTLDVAAAFLNEPRQQEFKLKLEAQVKNSK